VQSDRELCLIVCLVYQSRDAARLMSCVGYVLAILPFSEIMDYLNMLLTPHFDQLCHLAQAKVRTVVFTASKLVCMVMR
jgi:hypothetical protein